MRRGRGVRWDIRTVREFRTWRGGTFKSRYGTVRYRYESIFFRRRCFSARAHHRGSELQNTWHHEASRGFDCTKVFAVVELV